LDRKARLAATASINKGKARDAEAPGRRRDARQPVVGARLAYAIGIPRRRRCYGRHFHGFARWRPYGYDIAASKNAQDEMPRTDYNVAHCLGGTGS